ncbi:Protein LURP-one-related 7 [Forsythia ovata]|uniref:Protein LURP-one-related 7 n=1 Tax=Forsythia ovata TaxID=205694 RepID=A0ABD1RJJ6_9LAMI
MEENSTASDQHQFQADFQIPFDYFVSKKHKAIGTSDFLGFTDSFGNLIYRVQHQSQKSKDHPHCITLFLDASGDTLFTIHRVNKGSWQGFRGNDSREKDLIFKVDRTLNEFTRTEFEILFVDENNEDSKTEFKMKGCPFKRSCTIYKGDSIVAETSLMLKLGIKKIFVSRSRFRVTIFPGCTDHSLVLALIVIYFDGRKLWI